MIRYLIDARKALAALAGLAGQAVALGVLHGSALHYVQLVLAAATFLGVYSLPNGDRQGTVPAVEPTTADDVGLAG